MQLECVGVVEVILLERLYFMSEATRETMKAMWYEMVGNTKIGGVDGSGEAAHSLGLFDAHVQAECAQSHSEPARAREGRKESQAGAAILFARLQAALRDTHSTVCR